VIIKKEGVSDCRCEKERIKEGGAVRVCIDYSEWMRMKDKAAGHNASRFEDGGRKRSRKEQTECEERRVTDFCEP
jgi:hypothetical protein